MTIFLLCPTEAAQSQSTASNTAQTLLVLNYTGPEMCFNKDDSDSLALKKPLGLTANLFTTQLFCASLYRHVLSSFKFAMYTMIKNMQTEL